MEIGEVIRKYRKEKHLTQEEMANCLGVTVPAVSKWENGNSYPDIALLSPIARLLGITTDTLLAFRDELTEKEIREIVCAVGEKAKTEGYDAAFAWAEEQLKEYPNCGKLVVLTAQVLDNYRYIVRVEEPEQYDEKIDVWYRRFLDSSDDTISQTAAYSLFFFSMRRKDYETAEKCIGKIPVPGRNPKQLQGLLFRAQGKREEAYRCFEELAYLGYMDINLGLTGIQSMAAEEGDTQKADRMEEKIRQLTELMEIGRYADTSGLQEALQTKDKEAVFDFLTQFIDNLNDHYSMKSSDLYAHLTFSQAGPENVGLMLKKALEDDESLDYLKSDERWKELMKKLGSLRKTSL